MSDLLIKLIKIIFLCFPYCRSEAGYHVSFCFTKKKQGRSSASRPRAHPFLNLVKGGGPAPRQQWRQQHNKKTPCWLVPPLLLWLCVGFLSGKFSGTLCRLLLVGTKPLASLSAISASISPDSTTSVNWFIRTASMTPERLRSWLCLPMRAALKTKTWIPVSFTSRGTMRVSFPEAQKQQNIKAVSLSIWLNKKHVLQTPMC